MLARIVSLKKPIGGWDEAALPRDRQNGLGRLFGLGGRARPLPRRPATAFRLFSRHGETPTDTKTLVEIRTGSEYSADTAEVQARQEGTNGRDGRDGEIEGVCVRPPFFGGAR